MSTPKQPCRQVARRLAVWPTLTALERANVEHHGAGCASCAAALAEAKHVAATLESLREGYQGLRYEGPPPRLRPQSAVPPARLTPWWPRALAAAALVTLIVGGASLVRRAAMETWETSGTTEAVRVEATPHDAAPSSASPEDGASVAPSSPRSVSSSPTVRPSTVSAALRTARQGARQTMTTPRPVRPAGMSLRMPKRPVASPSTPSGGG